MTVQRWYHSTGFHCMVIFWIGHVGVFEGLSLHSGALVHEMNLGTMVDLVLVLVKNSREIV